MPRKRTQRPLQATKRPRPVTEHAFVLRFVSKHMGGIRQHGKNLFDPKV